MLASSYARSAFAVGVAVVLATACDSGVVLEPENAVIAPVQVLQDAPIDTAYTEACIDALSSIVACPATDMAKIARDGKIEYEHEDYDWSDGPVHLYAARNETVAFQVILRKTSEQNITNLSLDLGPLIGSNGIQANGISQSLFNAFYHPIDNAGYTWGPPTPVLPWPAEYPDALVPAVQACTIATSSNIEISKPVSVNTNQAIWIDTYIPKNTLPGDYDQTLTLSVNNESIALPVKLTVVDTQLPDKPSINAVGELYRSYLLEGQGFDITSPGWRSISQCYQRLAHQHRLVFIERLPDQLSNEQLENYADTIDPALTGTLFDPAQGYIGPGENTPVALWKTPWPQNIDANSVDGLSEREISRFESLASTWDATVSLRNWNNTDFFAYVFDEVDGPGNIGREDESRTDYIERVHNQMAQVQSQIDSGTNNISIDLLWTSHSNPAQWENEPGLDLAGTIRLWAPNASAADTEFLQKRIELGESAWFYHSGHPAVGAHSINVSGIEMRTWGVIGARYNFQGQFMWAINLGSNDFPYRDPQYREDEDRAGNGVLVYPGNQLDKIGYESSPGPIPSMRLKAWRRGLQDAELYYLANANNPEQASQLIKQQVPTALSEGAGAASWPNDSAAWVNFHKALLELATTP